MTFFHVFKDFNIWGDKMNSPSIIYSGYQIEPKQSNRCCQNCKYYIPVDEYMGKCYEFEVLPYAGCNFYEEKENKN